MSRTAARHWCFRRISRGFDRSFLRRNCIPEKESMSEKTQSIELSCFLHSSDVPKASFASFEKSSRGSDFSGCLFRFICNQRFWQKKALHIACLVTAKDEFPAEFGATITSL